VAHLFIGTAEFGNSRAGTHPKARPSCLSESVDQQSHDAADKQNQGRTQMIELTRLNGSLLVVNSDLIQYAESAPDTTLTFLNGEKVVVRESPARVIDLAVAYRARVMGEAAEHVSGGMVLASGAVLRALSVEKKRRVSRRDRTRG
jgi:flagellar protein FlbD